MSIFVDFVGLNTVTTSSFLTGTFDNVLSAGLNPNMLGTSLDNKKQVFPAINIHRNGPYSFATFKQIRIHENPLSRYQRTKNLISYTEEPSSVIISSGSAATGSMQVTFPPADGETFTVSDGGLGGGVGQITFTIKNSPGATNSFIQRSTNLTTMIENMISKINAYPNLQLNSELVADPSHWTGKKILINNLHNGKDGNVLMQDNTAGLYLNVVGLGGGVDNVLNSNPKPQTFLEPAVVSSYHPLVYNLGTFKGESVPYIERFGLSFDYSNHITYFTNEKLNELLLLSDMDDEVYDQIKDLYLKGALESNASEVDYFEFLRYRQDIFPREINKYSADVRQRTNYSNLFWRDTRSGRNLIHKNGFGFAPGNHSVWNLDAVADWATRSSVALIVPGNEGTLQHATAHFSSTPIKFTSAVYNRRHTIGLGYTASVVAPSGIPIPETGSGASAGVGVIFQGDALWQAGEQAGKNPFYASYDYFAEELRGIGKDYSIVPEYRISTHVEKLLRKGSRSKMSNMFELTGGAPDKNVSNEKKFYQTYSSSDFLRHFASIREDHKDFEDPGTITLTCKALKKFLAYDSFYPQDRSLDCAQQFYDSYERQITGSIGTLKTQPFLDTLFAPGVFYNTVKSGLAVDYPILTEKCLIYSSGNVEPKFYGIGNSTFDKRVPFEALVEPEKYLSELSVISNVVHPSGAVNNTSSWDGKGNNLYTKMMSNYLAEIPEFFLRGSQLSMIASEEQGSDNFGVADFDRVYAMRLKIYKTTTRNSAFFERQSITGDESNKVGGYTPPQARGKMEETITMYSRPTAFGPPSAGYVSGDSPRQRFYDSRDGINSPFTPPYYDGQSWIDFIWRSPKAGTAALSSGQQTGKFSLSEIFSTMTASALRFDSSTLKEDVGFSTTAGPLNWGTSINVDFQNEELFNVAYYPPARSAINVNSMQLDASLNFKQAGRLIASDIENDTLLNENLQQAIDVNSGAPNARWIIQTKFETPILNFKNVSLTTSSVNLPTAQTPRGMWHQYGVIPENTDGIYIQIQDLPTGWLKYKNYTGGGANSKWTSTGSLAQLCGFPTTPVKLGQVAQGRAISEAVVAVPYVEVGGVKKFFEINQDNYNSAKKYFQAVDIVNKGGNPDNLGLGNPDFWEERAGSTVINQVRKMKKYVFPPTMDFVSYQNVTPFAMYIFEFEHILSQQDLSDIWQGLPPEIGTSF